MIWTTLLRLRAHLQQSPRSSVVHIGASDRAETIVGDLPAQPVAQGAAPSPTAALQLQFAAIGEKQSPLSISAVNPFAVDITTGHSLLESERRELELYLPYALLPWFSHRQGRTFAISHFAQTLDGRIASASGDSKWIGNQENLTHAHKMRALCDAILVGTATLRADQPRLSVRHVSGVNPLRVILGENFSEADIDSDNEGPVLVINQRKAAGEQNLVLDQLTLAATNGKIDCQDILGGLFTRGIGSIYIEGGATTTSQFLAASCLDQVQIHVSPRILGSGITGFKFTGVNTMDEAVNFSSPRFLPMGDQVMFVGEVTQPVLESESVRAEEAPAS